MLEITPDDVALLNDTDLRTPIGLLCESELRWRGLSATAVTWSGHQNSADGELDVRVALAQGETIEGFVPRPQTGFQVKKSPMPRAEILDEMGPKGVLRHRRLSETCRVPESTVSVITTLARINPREPRSLNLRRPQRICLASGC